MVFALKDWRALFLVPILLDGPGRMAIRIPYFYNAGIGV